MERKLRSLIARIAFWFGWAGNVIGLRVQEKYATPSDPERKWWEINLLLEADEDELMDLMDNVATAVCDGDDFGKHGHICNRQVFMGGSLNEETGNLDWVPVDLDERYGEE